MAWVEISDVVDLDRSELGSDAKVMVEIPDGESLRLVVVKDGKTVRRSLLSHSGYSSVVEWDRSKVEATIRMKAVGVVP